MDDRMAMPVPNLLNLPDYRIITADETDGRVPYCRRDSGSSDDLSPL